MPFSYFSINDDNKICLCGIRDSYVRELEDGKMILFVFFFFVCF